ncbi:MAG: hypothetical protein M8467_20665 [Anaerolineae bacterium]|nr:hypothetical protein [Anaerolineae bacterium]
MTTPVLTTKLHIPSLRRNLVPRQRLLERLDEGLRRKLTLVSAPAGFGKTTLLAGWIQGLGAAGSPPVKVAWISLDEGDNDPVRFSAYLTAALQRTDQGISPTDGEPFDSPFLSESHLIEWINQVSALPYVFVLALDEYHLIAAQAVHDAVTFLVNHLPDNLHVVLATRGDPPLPLARLRARGQLVELRQSDLRFTTEEAAHFLNRVMGLDLSAKIEPTSSSSRWTKSGAGTVTIASLPSCCAGAWDRRAPSWCPTCTAAPASGTSGRGWWPRPSSMPWPRPILSGQPP